MLAVIVAVAVLGVIFAPWVTRLVRSLAAERAERVRSQARAEMGAHLHDSVLQTLALVQKRADDPSAVAALARTQERELRAWLAGREGGHERLAAALEGAAGEVEERPRRERRGGRGGRRRARRRDAALVAASREAMVNAAKFAPGAPVDVYAEVGDGTRLRCSCATAAPASTRPRCRPTAAACASRSSGACAATAAAPTIHAAPGGGTEVELMLPVAP